ncbi:recombination regulator RecX [bacterium]|nr:recombination regulator RecX [bacterium]
MPKEEKKKTFEQFYAMGLRYLTASIKTEFEVRKYLQRKKVPEFDIERIVIKLKNYCYIDDDEYTRIFTENKRMQNMSPFAVKYGLKQKGIESPKAEKIVKKIYKDFNEKKVARELVLAKAAKMTDKTPTKKLSKIMSFLKRKGFDRETIYYAMEPLMSQLNKEG